MRRPSFSWTRQSLIVVAAVCTVLIGCGVGAWLLFGSHPAKRAVVKNRFSPDRAAASWTKPWRAGNPQARRFGEAFQVLSPAHPPTVDRDTTFWLGPKFGGFFPYVRALMGHGAETMLSTTVYGDAASAEYAHLELVAYDTAPLRGGAPSEGSKLADQFHRLPHRRAGRYVWTDLQTPAAGWQAAVQVAPRTLVKIIRLDGRAPALPAIVSALRRFDRRTTQTAPASRR